MKKARHPVERILTAGRGAANIHRSNPDIPKQGERTMRRTRQHRAWFGIAALGLSLFLVPMNGTEGWDRMPSPAGQAPTGQAGYGLLGHGDCGSIDPERDGEKVLPADYRGAAPGLFTPARHCLRQGPWSGPDLSSRRISST